MRRKVGDLPPMPPGYTSPPARFNQLCASMKKRVSARWC